MQCDICDTPMTKVKRYYEPRQGQFVGYDVWKCWKCGAETEEEGER